MNIEFISTSRYPTQKAYGVTIGNSCLAARNLGFNAQISSISSSGVDEYGNKVHQIESYLGSKLFYLMSTSSNRMASRITFNLLSIHTGYMVSKRFKNRQNDLLWLRNTLTTFALVLLKNENRKILEIHHIPNSLDKLLIRKLISRQDIQIFTITERHRTRLRELFPVGNIGLAPMATPKEFAEGAKTPSLASPIKIGYVGKFTSSGNDNGLLEFLGTVAKIPSGRSDFLIEIIGIEEERLEALNEYLSQSIFHGIPIKVTGSVPHSQIKKYLSDIDIGVIPYQQSSYNDNRFPIKILEYASVKCLILVSDIPAHRAILDESKAVFFNPNNPDSLHEAVSWIRLNNSECAIRIENAHQWAMSHTYENRILGVMQDIR
jgi:glycosyltransferase involved in cell wall biosynthesis